MLHTTYFLKFPKASVEVHKFCDMHVCKSLTLDHECMNLRASCPMQQLPDECMNMRASCPMQQLPDECMNMRASCPMQQLPDECMNMRASCPMQQLPDVYSVDDRLEIRPEHRQS